MVCCRRAKSRGFWLNAELVTLSACDTGSGSLHGQDGVASLVRPFIAAGARTVVANLWTADDTFSLALMREFYRQLPQALISPNPSRSKAADVGDVWSAGSAKAVERRGRLWRWCGKARPQHRANTRGVTHVPTLTTSQRRSVMDKVLLTIDKKFMGTAVDTKALRERHQDTVVAAGTDEAFETAVNQLLKDLGASHTGFFHEGTPRAAGRIAIAATFTRAETRDGERWVFQDVHPGGVAAAAGIRPGDALLAIGDKEFVPPEATLFALGQHYPVTVRRADGLTISPTLAIPTSRDKRRPLGISRPRRDSVPPGSRNRPNPRQHVPRCIGDGCRTRHQSRCDRSGERLTDHRLAREHRRRHRLPSPYEPSLPRPPWRWL